MTNQGTKWVATIILLTTVALTQLVAQRAGNVYVDSKGTMRWQGTREEVKGFGVNYTAPFAHAYRSAKRLGVPLSAAIDADIYHCPRMRFAPYRGHGWPTQSTDTPGNVLEPEHLDISAHIPSKMKSR